MKNVVCIIARTKSKRLKQKVLKEIHGMSMIEYIIGKMKRSKYTHEIYLCTSNLPDDQILIDIAKKNGIKSYAGDPDAPIERMMKVAEIEDADNVVRVTGDNVFCDETYLDLMFKYHIENNAEYTRTEFLPVGVTSEVMKVEALKDCFNTMPVEFSEYLLLYMFQPSKYNCQVLIPNERHKHPNWSLTVDTPEDWDRTLEIIGENKDLLRFNQIVHICTNNSIMHLEYSNSSQIKFPGNCKIYFDTFRYEMNERIKRSKQIYISEEEYLSAI